MDGSRPPSVVDRYFKKHYKTDIHGKVCEDQLVLTHSNRICVVCIALSHPIICGAKSISSIKFQGDGWNRLENTVTGKNKRGAQWLERTAPLCSVTCTDGCVYTLVCCVKGQLVEINTNLLANPNLLTEKPSTNGYIAVILPGLKHFDREVERLKSEEQYRNILSLRDKETTDQNEQTLAKLAVASSVCEVDIVEQTADSHTEQDSKQRKGEKGGNKTSHEESCGNQVQNTFVQNLL